MGRSLNAIFKTTLNTKEKSLLQVGYTKLVPCKASRIVRVARVKPRGPILFSFPSSPPIFFHLALNNGVVSLVTK